MSEHDFLHALKEDLPEGFAQELKAKLDTLDKPARNKRLDNHHTFWTVAAASLVTVLLGVILLVSRVPQLQMLMIAPPAPVPSFTQHDMITSANIDQLEPFARLGNGMITGMHMMPDGEHLLITATTGLYLHDAQNLSIEPQQIYEGSIGYYSDIDANGNLYGLPESIFPPREQIVVARWNSSTGERTNILSINEFSQARIDGLEVKPDGSQVMLSLCHEFWLFSNFGIMCSQHTYVWYDTATGEKLHEIGFPASNVSSDYAMSDDWSRFAYSVDTDTTEMFAQPVINMVDMATFETRTVITISAPQGTDRHTVWHIGEISFSNNGNDLVLQSGFVWYVAVIYDADSLWQTPEPVDPRVHNETDRILYEATDTLADFSILVSDGQRFFALSNRHLQRYDFVDSLQQFASVLKADLNDGYAYEPVGSFGQSQGRPIFSPDNSRMYVWYEGNVIMAYDTETLSKIDETAYFQNENAQQFQFTSDGSQVIVRAGGYTSGIPDIWTITTDTPTHTAFLPDGELATARQFALSPDGMDIAYQLTGHWDVPNDLWIQSRDGSRSAVRLASHPNLVDLQFLEDGTLAGMTAHTSFIRWSAEDTISDYAELQRRDIAVLNDNQGFSSFAGASHMITDINGRWLATSTCQTATNCERSIFQLWDTTSEEMVMEGADQGFFRFGSMAFSPDGQLFAYGYCAEEVVTVDLTMNCPAGEVQVYAFDDESDTLASEPEPMLTLTGFTQMPTNIAFNSIQQDDGSWLVAITEWNTRTQLWHIKVDGTAEVLRILDDVRLPVAFDPTGGLMFTTADTAQTEVWGVPLP